MKDSNSLGQLLVRVNLINEDQLKYAEDEVKYQAQLGKKVTLVQILVKAGMVKQEQLTDILGVQMQSVTKKRIGEMLLDQGFITQDQLNEALEKQKTSGGKRLGRVLVDLKFIDEKKLTDILCCQFEVPFVKLDAIKLDEKVYEYITEEQCKAHKIVPLYVTKDSRQALVVAMADPTNVRLRDSIKFKVKKNVDVVMASEQDIKKTIDILFAGHGPAEESLAELIGSSNDDELETVERGSGGGDEPELTDEEGRQVVKIVTTLIHEAIARHASDIHLEPQETFLKLRYRIDGDLQVMSPIPARLMPQILSRIKLLSKMDIAEKRKPLDGRFTVRYKGSEVDLRVSSFPISLRKRGVCEKIVMRILDPNSGQFPLKEMGFDARVLKQFIDAINAPNGIVLVTGPTGSGKSTTLYASIREILDSTINISTMEDPVELNIDGVNQGQINNAAGFTFAAAFPRLLEMGLEPFLVSTAIKGVLAQRLVRRICKNCKEPVEISQELRDELHLSPDMQFYHGRGCEKCDGSGFKGRCGIYEFLVPNEAVRNLVIKRASGDEIKREAIKSCEMITLRMDGINKALQGLTTLEQAIGASTADE